jgi:hypothetical protein
MTSRNHDNTFPNPLSGDPGISIREYTAIRMMAALMEAQSGGSPDNLADEAVRATDALISRLNK